MGARKLSFSITNLKEFQRKNKIKSLSKSAGAIVTRTSTNTNLLSVPNVDDDGSSEDDSDSNQTQTKQLNAATLLERANTLYTSAYAIESQNCLLILNWAYTLHCYGKTANSVESALEWFAQSFEKYVKAQSLMKDSAVPSKRCGRGYLSQREWLLEKAADDHVTKDLLDKAEEQFLLGESIEKGSCAFELACVASLKGDSNSARRWLTEANKIHSYSASELTSEPWLVGVRAESWFRKLIG
eukprot:CAMPEP_0168599846 /NCGR_PEP_ID=MMETSP0420-20121227/12372_1 /TAXON_ID=498008 /ORGANISM="Pessonella sp." /LENGTH=241 /DNA_ID=CAMNT_0008637705 /DNA_START=168 /DNA_END=889 /DNA_ORIENTATION=+